MQRALFPVLSSSSHDEEDLFFLHLTLSHQREPRICAIESEAIRNMISKQDDLGYQKYIRLDRALFHQLLPLVASIHEKRLVRDSKPYKKPRPNRRALSTKESLFITLRFLAGGTSDSDLAVQAGVAAATIVRTKSAILPCLLVALRHCHDARIHAPTIAEAAELCKYVTALASCFSAFSDDGSAASFAAGFAFFLAFVDFSGTSISSSGYGAGG